MAIIQRKGTISGKAYFRKAQVPRGTISGNLLMLQLDSVTQAALEAAATPTARAQAVLTSISGAVTVTVYDGSGNVKGSGSMTKLGTLSANVIVLDPTTSFSVSSTGTPDPATWTIEFKNGSNKWMKGSFGLSSSPSAEFKWSLGTWTSGQAGTISNAYATVQKREVLIDVTDTFNVEESTSNSPPVWTSGTPSTLSRSRGSTYDFKPHAYDADGDSPLTYTLEGTQYTGITLVNGVLTIATAATLATRTLTIRVKDPSGAYDDHTCVVTITAASTARFLIPPDIENRTFSGSNYPLRTGGTATPVAGDIIELGAGTHGKLKFVGLAGDSNNRVIIRGPQTDGQRAIIRSKVCQNGNFLIEFTNCRYFTVDGYQPTLANTQAGAYQCGIKATYSTQVRPIGDPQGKNFDNPSMWIKCSPSPSGANLNPCHDYTFRYIEVDGGWRTVNSFGAAFYIHSVSQSRLDYPGQWIAENVLIEHTWTHWARNSFYLGPNYQESGGLLTIPCRNIEVRYNRCEDIGGSAIHCKAWWEGNNSIHHNYVTRTGRNWEQFDGQQSNTRAGIDTFNCEVDVYNNYIHDVGESHMAENNNGHPNALWFATSDMPANTVLEGYGSYPYLEVRAWNNHISKAARHAIAVYASTATNSIKVRPFLYNNTAYDALERVVSIERNNGGWMRNCIALQGVDPNVYGSITPEYCTLTGSPSTIFENSATYDLRLKNPIAATGTVGVDIAATDLNGVQRTSPYDRGAYEKV